MSLVPLLQLYSGGAHLHARRHDLHAVPRPDLNNKPIAVWLAHTAFGLPLAIFLLHNYIAVAAARRVRGGDDRRRQPLRHLLADRAAAGQAGLAAFAIFQFLWVWNDYLVALIFLSQNPDASPLTIQLVNLVTSRGPGHRAAPRGGVHLDRRAAHHLLLAPALLRPRPARRLRQGIGGRPWPRSPSTDVNKVYDNGYHAVHDLDLDIADGEFLVLVGPVGLRQVHGAADGRRARVDHVGQADDRRPGRQRRPPEGPRHRDGVPELRAVPAHDGAPRTSASPSSCASAPEGRDRASGCRRRRGSLELDEYLDRKPGQLSGGQRQRVAMGRAIVRRPAGVPHGRAAVEPRRQAAGADARRDQPASSTTSA